MSVNDRCRLLAALAILCAPLAACQDANTRTVIYLLPTRIDEFQTESQKAIEVVFKELGYDVSTFDANDRPDLQLQQLDAAVERRPAAIILNTVDFIKIAPGIAKANAAHIPLLVYDRRLSKSTEKMTVDFSSVTDAADIGKQAAEQIKSLLDPAKTGQGDKRVLQITGDPGDSYSLEVQRGFLGNISPGISVTSRAAINWDPRNAEEIANAELRAHKFDVVFAHGADLLGPLIKLIDRQKRQATSGKEPAAGEKPIQNADKIILMASNGAPVGLRNIDAGSQQIEIEQPLYAQVYGLAMAFQLIVAGRSNELQTGPCKLIGVDGEIERTAGDFGPVLKLKGRVIDRQNSRDLDLHLWGNGVPPNVSAGAVKCER